MSDRVEYKGLYRFTQKGNEHFEKELIDNADDDSWAVHSRNAERLPGSKPFVIESFETAGELGQAVVAALGDSKVSDLLEDRGLWNWLTYVLRRQLFTDSSGQYVLKERPRWDWTSVKDYRKIARHQVRMPAWLMESFGERAAHLVCTPPNQYPDIRERLASQQDLFSDTMLEVGQKLFYDEASRSLKRGHSHGVDRLVKVKRQLDVTWDLSLMSADQVLRLLPAEFDEFKSPKKVVRKAASAAN